jgi:hypothetical protein
MAYLSKGWNCLAKIQVHFPVLFSLFIIKIANYSTMEQPLMRFDGCSRFRWFKQGSLREIPAWTWELENIDGKTKWFDDRNYVNLWKKKKEIDEMKGITTRAVFSQSEVSIGIPSFDSAIIARGQWNSHNSFFMRLVELWLAANLLRMGCPTLKHVLRAHPDISLSISCGLNYWLSMASVIAARRIL